MPRHNVTISASPQDFYRATAERFGYSTINDMMRYALADFRNRYELQGRHSERPSAFGN